MKSGRWKAESGKQKMENEKMKEALYAIALSRLSGVSMPAAIRLLQELGTATAIYENRNSIADIIGDSSPRLQEALLHWEEPLRRAEDELLYDQANGVIPLPWSDNHYPQRLKECPDAPVVLYYKGSADLNALRVVSIVGTRHCTAYGQDLVRRFCQDLRSLCPETLIVSGLAYGVDINAHREALANGLPTVGVLAHGLDDLYPPRHQQTADEMTKNGGLLTEFMSMTVIDKGNFVRRNRIVAGMADATILVESGAKGGGLITCGIARDYNREVCAFPGHVGAPYSEGCNNLIRDNGASLITSASDFIRIMGWQPLSTQQEQRQHIERQLFPELTDEEQAVVKLLQQTNDLQVNIIAVKSGIAIGRLTALLFGLEMKGVVKPYSGGTYHLLT